MSVQPASGSSRAGVAERPGSGVYASLVDARVENVATAAERLGGAVAVVHVPVEHEDALGAEVADRERGRDCDVVEQAEPHRPVGFRVVGVIVRWAP